MKDAFYVQLARVPFAIMQCDIIIAWMSLPISFAVWENEEIMVLGLLIRKPRNCLLPYTFTFHLAQFTKREKK